MKGYHKTLILGTFCTVSNLIIVENWKHLNSVFAYLKRMVLWKGGI